MLLQITDDHKDKLEDLSNEIFKILLQSEGDFIKSEFKIGPMSTCRMEFYDPKVTSPVCLGIKYFLPLKRIVIQRVLLENRRHGIMTKIIEMIKERSEICKIDSIVIESVISPEMAHFALKNGFHIDKSSGGYIHVKSFFSEDDTKKETIFAGNYILNIRGDKVA